MPRYFLLLATYILCISTFIHAEDSDEALFVRRITEFHKDGESALVKAQVREFLETYPTSSFSDSVKVILGDTLWAEGNYQAAKRAYNSIQSSPSKSLVRNNYIDTLYHLHDYEDIISSVEALEDTQQQPIHLLYYAEALRQQSQDKPELSIKAKYTFLRLLPTEYASLAKPPLADLYLQNKEFDSAYELYVGLAATAPEKKDEYLLQAARIKAAEDPALALNLINEIDNPEALCLKGRCHFALKDYKQALIALKHTTTTSQNPDWSILYMLIVSAHECQEYALQMEWSSQFQKLHPQEKALSHILFMDGVAHMSQGNNAEAIDAYEKVLNDDEDTVYKSSTLYHLASLHAKEGNFPKSHAYYLELVEAFPNFELSQKAIRQLPLVTLKALESDSTDSLRNQLIADIDRATSSTDLLDDEEQAKYALLLAQTYVEVKDFDKAKFHLQEYISARSNDPKIASAYLLLALCAQQCNDNTSFIDNAEKAVALNPTQPQSSKLRLALFNAYMQLPANTEAAAGHLYWLVMFSDEPIKLANQLWLANFFYNQVKSSDRELTLNPLFDETKIATATKAAEVFNKALKGDEGYKNISPDTLYLEPELLKLSLLYSWLQDYPQQQKVLEHLTSLHDKQLDLKWGLQKRAKHGLASALQYQGMNEEAHRLYNRLAKEKGADPFIVKNAKLQEARLNFASVSPNGRTLEHPTILTSLKTLKDLQIRKQLQHEPLHLEAALDYVRVRSSVEPESNKLQSEIQLLQRAYASFTCQDDLCSKEYHAARLQQPEKDRIYQAYLLLIQAHLNTAEAALIAKKGNAGQAATYHVLANQQYTTIVRDYFDVSKYLVDQARSALNLLNINSSSESSYAETTSH